MEPTAAEMISLYREMARIRKVQLRIESLYHLDEMKTPIHLYIGQEAIAAGVCRRLTANDYVCTNHRGHGHYLAKGGNLKAMIAELYCRETGCAKSRGGSMHLVDPSVGLVGSSSIVAGGIPIAVGLALAIQMQDLDRVSVVFFGDGAADEGVLYESVNFAVLKRLPVIFVYEDNEFSVCSRVGSRRRGGLLFHGMPSELLYSRVVDGNSVLDVWDVAGAAVQRARRREGPCFLDCKTYRIRGHMGAGDSPAGYRNPDEMAAWEQRCPLTMFRTLLIAQGVASEDSLEIIDGQIDREIEDAFRFAQESPTPDPGTLHQYLYREQCGYALS
jgi:pyruvate dehydrogenase E1 component alpha subunit